MNTTSARRGFTLVEILIVVAIIATLASVALVGLGPVQRSGRDTRRISDLRQIQNGVELYFAKCGYYPGSAVSGVDSCTGFTVVDYDGMATALTQSELGISKIPNDPQSGKAYRYGSTNGSTYVLGATLENAGSSQLRDDVDGTVEGVDCEDPVYCVQL